MASDRLSAAGSAGSGVTVSIDASAFEHAAAELNAAGFEAVAEHHVEHALRQAANVLRDNVRHEAARHRLEGAVHTSWRGAGLTFSIRVGLVGKPAIWIALGTRAHRIDAHLGRRMPIGGSPIRFAEHVQSRGLRPDAMVSRGIEASREALRRIVDQAGAAMVAELASRVSTTEG